MTLARGVLLTLCEPCGLGLLTIQPLALEPSEQLRHRLLQRRDVLRDQDESERQHPQAEHWQNAEDATEDEQDRQRETHELRRRLAQPTHEAGWSRRQPGFK